MKSMMDDIKYEILYEAPVILFGRKLYRIIAKRSFTPGASFGDVQTGLAGKIKTVVMGETGGFVEGPWNLSQEGSCWIGKGAAVFGRASVSENAYVHGIVKIDDFPTVTVRDRARAFGNSEIRDYAELRDASCAGGSSVIRQYARLEDNTVVIDSDVGGYAHLLNGIYLKGSDKIIDYNSRPVRICNASDLEKAVSTGDEKRSRAVDVTKRIKVRSRC